MFCKHYLWRPPDIFQCVVLHEGNVTHLTVQLNVVLWLYVKWTRIDVERSLTGAGLIFQEPAFVLYYGYSGSLYSHIFSDTFERELSLHGITIMRLEACQTKYYTVSVGPSIAVEDCSNNRHCHCHCQIVSKCSNLVRRIGQARKSCRMWTTTENSFTIVYSIIIT